MFHFHKYEKVINKFYTKMYYGFTEYRLIVYNTIQCSKCNKTSTKILANKIIKEWYLDDYEKELLDIGYTLKYFTENL